VLIALGVIYVALIPVSFFRYRQVKAQALSSSSRQ